MDLGERRGSDLCSSSGVTAVYRMQHVGVAWRSNSGASSRGWEFKSPRDTHNSNFGKGQWGPEAPNMDDLLYMTLIVTSFIHLL